MGKSEKESDIVADHVITHSVCEQQDELIILTLKKKSLKSTAMTEKQHKKSSAYIKFQLQPLYHGAKNTSQHAPIVYPVNQKNENSSRMKMMKREK
jgi:hypothetical protein